MRNIYLMFLLLLTCFALIACGNENSTDETNAEEKATEAETEKQSSSKLEQEQIDAIINEKIAQFNSEDDYDQYFNWYQTVKFFENDIPQILTINEVDSRSVVRVHMYDEQKQEWNVIYENGDHNSYDGTENLKILDTGSLDGNSEIALIGEHGGSNAYLNFYVLGEQDGEIAVTLGKMDINARYGDAYIEGNEIVVESEESVIERISSNDFTSPAQQSQPDSNEVVIVEKAEDLWEYSNKLQAKLLAGKYSSKNWEQAIQDIARGYDFQLTSFVELLEEKSKFKESEIQQFYVDIVQSYESGDYNNRSRQDLIYALELFFKSLVVQTYYEDVLGDEKHPIALFADDINVFTEKVIEQAQNVTLNKLIDRLDNIRYPRLEKEGLLP